MPPERQRSKGARIVLGTLAAVAGLAVVAVVVAVVLALIPAGTGGLEAHPQPTGSYRAAVERFDALAAREARVKPECRSRLLLRGRRTQRVVVLFHGLSSCPRQLLELGETLERRGANVLILRVPGHGLRGDAGRTGGLDAGDFRDYADDSIDIANGLGDHVTALGFSLGGVLAAWAAENRPEVDRAVVVAPAFAFGRVPSFLSTGFTNLFSRVPNVDLPSRGTSIPHAYPPALATHPTAEMYLLGKRVLEDAKSRSPFASSLTVVLNGNDHAVSNERAEELVRDWRANRPVVVERLPEEIGLPHDIVDAAEPNGRPEIVTPILAALAEGRKPPKLVLRP